MESLRFDVAPYGISTTVVEPGFFRTELLVEGASSIWPELSIDDYAERTAQTIEAWKEHERPAGRRPRQARPRPRAARWPSTSRRCAGSPAPTPWPRSSRKLATSSPRPTPTASSRPTRPRRRLSPDDQPRVRAGARTRAGAARADRCRDRRRQRRDRTGRPGLSQSVRSLRIWHRLHAGIGCCDRAPLRGLGR